MTRLIIEIENETYQKLEAEALKKGKKPDVLTRELLEKALQNPLKARDVKSILREKGRIRSNSNLSQNATPSLEEVCSILGKAGDPSLETLVDQQRGPKI